MKWIQSLRQKKPATSPGSFASGVKRVSSSCRKRPTISGPHPSFWTHRILLYLSDWNGSADLLLCVHPGGPTMFSRSSVLSGRPPACTLRTCPTWYISPSEEHPWSQPLKGLRTITWNVRLRPRKDYKDHITDPHLSRANAPRCLALVLC